MNIIKFFLHKKHSIAETAMKNDNSKLYVHFCVKT